MFSKFNPSILFNTLLPPETHTEEKKAEKQKTFIALAKQIEDRDLLKARNRDGDSVLHLMSAYGYTELVKEHITHPEKRKLAFIPNYTMYYPIHKAILNGQLDIVALLISLNGVENLTYKKNQNLLHFILRYGNGELFQACLNYYKPDIAVGLVNGLDINNKSPLHYAVESSKANEIILLLGVPGIDVNIVDDSGATPLDLLDEKNPLYIKIDALLTTHHATHNSKKDNRLLVIP